MTTSSKIKIKMGSIEVEYEGSDEFLKNELFDLVKAVSDLYKELPATQKNSPNQDIDTGDQKRDNLSTSTIATKIGSSSGSELALSASLKLTLVDKKTSFTRDEILTEMKKATAYYKSTYSNNLTMALKTLTKSGKLNELGQNKFSLTEVSLSENTARL